MKIALTGPSIARIRAVAFAVSVGLAVACAASARAQSPTDEAEALVRQGTELRHQNQDARALPLFERAYNLIRNPRTAAQLGLVKMALGYCVDAERLLDEALAVPDHPWIARNLDTLTQTRDSARKNIGEVVVAGNPIGAEVLLNGRAVGNLPLPAPIRLDKGSVEIQIRAAGHAALARSLKITAGTRENLWIALTPLAGTTSVAASQSGPATSASTVSVAATSTEPPSPATGAAPADTIDSSPATSLLRPLAWTAAVGGTLGLAMGVVETVVATHKIDAFNNHTSAATGAPDCARDQLSDACRSLSDAHDRAKVFAIVGYVAAGVLAATSATLFVVSAHHQTSSPQAGLACAPALLSPGLTCRLTF